MSSFINIDDTEEQKEKKNSGINPKIERETQPLESGLSLLKTEQDLKILEYLKNHPELFRSRIELSQILKSLRTETTYAQILAWILSPENTNLFGPCLLAQTLLHTHPEYDRKFVMDLLSHNYNVFPAFSTSSGQVDILIAPKDSKKFTILIETVPKKLESMEVQFSEEQDNLLNQLRKYEKWAKRQDYEHILLLFLNNETMQIPAGETAFKPLAWRTLLHDLKHLLSNLIISNKIASFITETFIRDLENLTSR